MIKQQEDLMEKQKEFDQRIVNLEDKLLLDSSGISSKQRARISRQLTVSLVIAR